MSNKEDFRGKIEAHRQTIEEEQNTAPSRMSRANRNQTKIPKKKKGSPLIKILFIVFICIPLTMLVYVKFFYNPSVEKPVVEADSKETVVKVEANDEANEVDETDKEDKESTSTKETDSTADEAAIEQSQKDAETLKESEEQADSSGQKKHVVQSNETLYRIAMRYYNDPTAVQKIIDSNNLSSDTISAGQTLIIPE